MVTNITDTALGVTVLGSGSKGNAVVVQKGNDGILIDAGFSLKELRRRMKQANVPEQCIRAILITHEHDDHIKGLRVCAEHFNVPVYTTRKCADILRHRDSRLGQMTLFSPGDMFPLCGFTLCPFPISHDANDPVGFVVYSGNAKVGIATDFGYVSQVVEYQLQGCSTLVVESNHDLNMLAASSRPWSLKQRIMSRYGHLCNKDTGELLERIIRPNTQHVILAHLSEECNSRQLAWQCACQCLEHIDRKDIDLQIADQNQPLATVWTE